MVCLGFKIYGRKLKFIYWNWFWIYVLISDRELKVFIPPGQHFHCSIYVSRQKKLKWIILIDSEFIMHKQTQYTNRLSDYILERARKLNILLSVYFRTSHTASLILQGLVVRSAWRRNSVEWWSMSQKGFTIKEMLKTRTFYNKTILNRRIKWLW